MRIAIAQIKTFSTLLAVTGAFPALAMAANSYDTTSLTNINSSIPGATTARTYTIGANGLVYGSYVSGGATTYFLYNSTATNKVTTITGDYTGSGAANGNRLITASGSYYAQLVAKPSYTYTNNGQSYTVSDQYGMTGGYLNSAGTTYTQFAVNHAADTADANGNTTSVADSFNTRAINNAGYAAVQQIYVVNPADTYPSSSYYGGVYNPTTNHTTLLTAGFLGGGSTVYGADVTGISSTGAKTTIVGFTSGTAAPFYATLNGDDSVTATDFTAKVSGLAANFGGTYTTASATNISDNGQYVIGTYKFTKFRTGSTTQTTTFTRGFEYKIGDAAAIDLGDLSGITTSSSSIFAALTPYSVNDSGDVVGASSNGTANKAFYFANGQIYNLSTLTGISGTSFANGITNSGLISAYDSTAGLAYLVSPVPEPAALSLLAGGTFLLARRRRSQTGR